MYMATKLKKTVLQLTAPTMGKINLSPFFRGPLFCTMSVVQPTGPALRNNQTSCS